MISLFSSCLTGKKSYDFDICEDQPAFERFNYRNVSTRKSKKIGKKSPKTVTGMAKFRASQKLKRKAIEEQKKKIKPREEIKARLGKSQSQPTIRVKNFKPYDI